MPIRYSLHWVKNNRSTVLLMSLVALAVIVLGLLFYVRGQNQMQEDIKVRLRTIATGAAMLFNPAELDELHVSGDVRKKIYASIVERLNQVRTTYPEVRFVYIMRPTKDPKKFEFVADADSLHPFPPFYDLNGDGKIDSHDELSPPGMPYDVSGQPEFGQAVSEPVTADAPYTDQWGTLITGYAPILGSNGHPTTVLGVDMEVHAFQTLAGQLVSPLLLLLIVALGTGLGCVIALEITRRNVDMVNRMNSERSGLLRLTFHQLGEPLTIMKWSLETLREETDNPALKQIVADHLVCMDEGLGRLNSIIDTLQQAEKVDLNTLKYLPKPGSIKVLVENAVGEWQSSIDKRKQTLAVDMPLDIECQFDFNLIALVLRQVIENAIEFSPEASPITVRAYRSGKQVMFSVEDHGCGIPKKDLPRLFEKYHRASNAALHKPDGNGLGLYIAKGIVEKAGGTMRVESIEGVGTKVSFTLPYQA